MHLSTCTTWIAKSRPDEGLTCPVRPVQPPDLATRQEQRAAWDYKCVRLKGRGT
jgi:hypothetical protein